MQRIGVFVCWCGSNIAGTVDVKQVAEMLKHEPGVVICSCSPRMHENTFRKAAASVGLNPYMVEIANIREQCSWIHKDKAEATEKAIILGWDFAKTMLPLLPCRFGMPQVIRPMLMICTKIRI